MPDKRTEPQDQILDFIREQIVSGQQVAAAYESARREFAGKTRSFPSFSAVERWLRMPVPGTFVPRRWRSNHPALRGIRQELEKVERRYLDGLRQLRRQIDAVESQYARQMHALKDAQEAELAGLRQAFNEGVELYRELFRAEPDLGED